MGTSAVDRLYNEFSALISLLADASEPSLLLSAEDNFRKALLLAAASHFEKQLTEDILAYCAQATNSDELVTSFLKNKALTRQYHTLFNWESSNANHFFALFGPTFKEFMMTRVAADPSLDQSIRAFLQLGLDRNRLVHEDFATFPLEKTADEIFELYRTARSFVESLKDTLVEFAQGGPN